MESQIQTLSDHETLKSLFINHVYIIQLGYLIKQLQSDSPYSYFNDSKSNKVLPYSFILNKLNAVVKQEILYPLTIGV